MRAKFMAAAVALTTLAAVPAAGQQTADTGVATETQERRAEGRDNDFPWDLLGLLGLAGLLGLRRGKDHDTRRTNH